MRWVCSSETVVASGPVPRPTSTRTSGSGTRASSRSGSPGSTRQRAAGRAAGPVPGSVDERHAPAHDLRRRRARRRQHAGSGARRATRTHRATCATSCITQPPLPAIAAWHVAPDAPGGRARRRSSPRCSQARATTTGGCTASATCTARGLVTLIHPWECGLDTTPPWMDVAARACGSRGGCAFVLRWHLARLVRFFRRDTRFAPAAERTSDDDGLRMLVLARRAKRRGFDLAEMPPERLGADRGPRVQRVPRRSRTATLAADRRRHRRDDRSRARGVLLRGRERSARRAVGRRPSSTTPATP